MLPSEVFGVPTFELFIAINFVVLALVIAYLIRSLRDHENWEAVVSDAIAWLIVAYAEKGNKKKTLKLPTRVEIKSNYTPSKEARKLVEKVQKSVGEGL